MSRRKYRHRVVAKLPARIKYLVPYLPVTPTSADAVSRSQVAHKAGRETDSLYASSF